MEKKVWMSLRFESISQVSQRNKNTNLRSYNTANGEKSVDEFEV